MVKNGSKKGPKGSEKGPPKTPFSTFLEPFYSKNLSYEVVFVAFQLNYSINRLFLVFLLLLRLNCSIFVVLCHVFVHLEA